MKVAELHLQLLTGGDAEQFLSVRSKAPVRTRFPESRCRSGKWHGWLNNEHINWHFWWSYYAEHFQTLYVRPIHAFNVTPLRQVCELSRSCNSFKSKSNLVVMGKKCSLGHKQSCYLPWNNFVLQKSPENMEKADGVWYWHTVKTQSRLVSQHESDHMSYFSDLTPPHSFCNYHINK